LRIINTARGDLVDEQALADAIESGQIAGAGLDVFEKEPTVDQRLQKLPQVLATPHIAASTREGQELVGEETAEALRDFLKDGLIRNAVNFPSVSAEEFKRLQPFVDLGERLGTFVAQMNDHRITSVSIRYYGEIAQGKTAIVRNAILSGVFKPLLSTGITVINAAVVAAERGIEVVESHSTRTRNYASLISLRLRSSQGERWVEGAVFEHATPRLVLIDGITVEAHLEGTMIVTCNTDQPGVIGSVGTVLGKHHINIAQFALGRNGDRAMGIVTVDEPTPIPDKVLDELRQQTAIREVRLVRI